MSKIKVTIFEGIDGSGKTTLAKAFAKVHKTHYISFPTCKPPEFADRNQGAQWFLKDMQNELGKIVRGNMHGKHKIDHIVLDRSFISTVVYQGNVFDLSDQVTKNILEVGIEMFENDFEVVDIIIPETTPQKAAQRIQKRGAKDDELDMIEDLDELVARLEKYAAAFEHVMDLIKF